MTLPITRNGWAFQYGGREIRRVDLEKALGRATLSSPRFRSAEAADDRLTLAFDDGSHESIPLSAVVPRNDIDLVVTGTSLLMTLEGNAKDPLGLIANGAVLIGGGRIRWTGPSQELDGAGFDLQRADRIDCGGRLVTPGLVDCHAHPLFAGNRANEFAMRAEGKGYLEIAAAGGGIVATTGPTREASFDELAKLTRERARAAMAYGTTTLEAKSGYDLTADGELRLLEVARAVDAVSPVDLDPTLLGAHVIPPEYKERRDAYVDLVVQQMIPLASEQSLCRMVDVYCDEGAFTHEETKRILSSGQRAGLRARAHIGQFKDLGGAELLADIGGLSGDHLEQVSRDGARAMAAKGVVGVMLPGACTQLCQSAPPVDILRDAGVALAVASDMNPGTSMGVGLTIPMWLAVTQYRMTVNEVWRGVTVHAARALGRHDIGNLTVGALGDLVVWDAETPAEIPYRFDAQLVHRVVKAGRIEQPNQSF